MARYDLAIIGAGPGGYVAAIRAAQLGLKTALIEKERVGGLCLNWGCVPSKALLWNAELVHLFQRADEFGISARGLRFDLGKAVDRSRQVVEHTVKGVEFLLKRNKVEIISGAGRLHSPHEVEVAPDGPVGGGGPRHRRHRRPRPQHPGRRDRRQGGHHQPRGPGTQGGAGVHRHRGRRPRGSGVRLPLPRLRQPGHHYRDAGPPGAHRGRGDQPAAGARLRPAGHP